MDFTTHELSEGAVDHLVASDAAATLESGRDHSGFEMGLVVGADQDLGVGEARANEFGYFFRMHGTV